MKRTVVLMTIVAVVGRISVAQTSTASVTDESTGSGDYTSDATTDGGDVATETTTAAANPCLSDPCSNGGLCISLGATYDCECAFGYSGETCQTVDECTVIESYALNVTYDDSTCAVDNNATIDVTFPTSPAEYGTWIASEQTCPTSCPITGVALPLVVVECSVEGEKGDPQYTDCSMEQDNIPEEELLTYSVAATADPEDITAESVTFAVGSTESYLLNQKTITRPDANSAMDVYNNVLEATNADALDEVNQQSSSISNSLDIISNGVELSTAKSRRIKRAAASAQSYASIDDNIGLFVAKVTGDESNVCLIAPGGIDSTSLRPSGFRLVTNSTSCEDTSLYIDASGSLSGRISFRVYLSPVTLFKNIPDVEIQSIVLSAYGDAESFTFSFQNSTTSRLSSASCRIWNNVTSKWDDDPDVCVTSVDEPSNTVKCDCLNFKGGDVIIASNMDASGLSPGAIAGIVIGCVVAVALLGGGVYYFAIYAKKKKRKNAVGASRGEITGNDEDDD